VTEIGIGYRLRARADGPVAERAVIASPRSRNAPMKIEDLLSAHAVAIDVRASDKAGLLGDLAGRIAASVHIAADVLAAEIIRRDELGSTGIGGGVSIPHARFREVRKPYGFLVRLRQPIPFQAIDGKPVDIVFLLALPAADQLEQLNALAAVARKLRDPGTVRRLREAPTAAALYQAITV
jgi:PTS system nitrogen regulatory IIA component